MSRHSDAAGVIDELVLGPAVVLGHSMGARIGIRLAANVLHSFAWLGARERRRLRCARPGL
jgi:pimeloyl-ACP methyl ester carboxylesterase